MTERSIHDDVLGGIKNGPPYGSSGLANGRSAAVGEVALSRARRSPEPAYLSFNRRMKAIGEVLRQVAAWDVPVVLRGESGVGKEVLAREIHRLSPRAAHPLVKINCVALPSELLESELFGYERGAFTGAVKTKPGKFEMAERGTIFLDEIGDMDYRLQAKLLQVLQDGEVHRLGGKESIRVNVRVLVATHRDLERAIAEGAFREDLYYRLNVVDIGVPPLRERRDEILPLARHFLEKHRRQEWAVPPITRELEDCLLAYAWPGNVRELENVMRRFLVFGDPVWLAADLRAKARPRPAAPGTTAAVDSSPQSRPEANRASLGEQLRWLSAAAGDEYEAVATASSSRPPSEPVPQTEHRAGEEFVCEREAAGFELSDQGRELTTRARSQSEPMLDARNPDSLQAPEWSTRLHQVESLMEQVLASLSEARRERFADEEDPSPRTDDGAAESANPATIRQVDEARDRAEAEVILTALRQSRWNRKRAARMLEIDYKALLYRMKKLRIGEECLD